MRFTLPKLFLAITLAAVACAGMTLRTRGWAEAIVSLSILLYVVVAILAFRQAGRPRAFRIAFAAVGGGYLLVVLCSMFTPIRDLLVTNRALVLAGRALQVSTQAPQQNYSPSPFTLGAVTFNGTSPYVTPATGSGSVSGTAVGAGTLTLSSGQTWSSTSSFGDEYEWDTTFGFGSPTPSPQIPAGAFLVVGNCLWSWILALVAGWFAALVYRPAAAGPWKS